MSLIHKHVHCQACHMPIDAKPPAEFAVAQELAPMPTPEGIRFVPRSVPICPDCRLLIEEGEKQRQAASKLIVPGGNGKLEVIK